MPYNDLRAREGRETNALNCKPNTNLKENIELSNFSKTSGFILHAVIGWWSRPGSQINRNSFFSQIACGCLLAMMRSSNICPTRSQKK
jgi:hypothetical protein